MPYNTRRKSLSLPSLGIHVPSSSRSSVHRSPPATATAIGDQQQSPPPKRVKRSHSSTSNASTPASPPRPSPSHRFSNDRPKSSGRVADTPPPSPCGESGQTKVDTRGIDDIIVVGVIEQLEKTGNRPHLLKELAAVLSTTVSIVEASVNPAAIISSRLATYLKRPCWSALSRCPLEKELVGTHPKRVYYFLTTCPRQPIPVHAPTGPIPARIISPSLSSAASEPEEIETHARERMSPSPELDLSPPEFDADPFSHHLRIHTNVNIAHNRRAASPPLEHDEREFTQTAESLQERRKTQEAAQREASTSPRPTQSTDTTMADGVVQVVDESEEYAARKNSETAAALFGEIDKTFHTEVAASSPIFKHQTGVETTLSAFRAADVKMLDDFEFRWSELTSPESIDVDELDDMFDRY